VKGDLSDAGCWVTGAGIQVSLGFLRFARGSQLFAFRVSGLKFQVIDYEDC